ncbi:hypothetical protein H6F83_00820 [Coleofasciculus sp. FACHB-125]|nr:hypothetical protein [Coleofasciculus sp. FACHB-125]
MHCPECESQQVVKNGKVTLQDGAVVQKYMCKACRKAIQQPNWDSNGGPTDLLNNCDVGDERPH